MENQHKNQRKNKMVFVAEAGNNSFDFDNDSTHFILAAIIIEKDKKAQLTIEIDEIRKKYFQKKPQSEIKSAKVGQDDDLRKRILTDLLALDFQIYAVIIDKQRLYGEGFQYKKSFYKFLCGLLYKELYRTADVEVCANQHSSNPFMKEFTKYLHTNHIKPDLFSDANASFQFASSKTFNILQVADFVAGTLACIHDKQQKSPDFQEFEKLLAKKLIGTKFFPDDRPILEYAPTQKEENYDPDIAYAALKLISTYINEKKTSTIEEEKHQLLFLNILLFNLRIDLHKSVSTKEIINHLAQESDISEHFFRSNVIAKLRDEGILIASSQKGYKIPVCEKDVYQFLNHSNSIIINMLRRVEKAREMIALATGNKLDILDKEEYHKLKNLLDAK